MLASFVLTGHYEPCREVSYAYRRVGLVHMLPAGAGGPVRINAQVLLVDFNLIGHMFEERNYVKRSEARLATMLRIKWRDPHQSMNTTLCGKEPVCKAPANDE